MRNNENKTAIMKAKMAAGGEKIMKPKEMAKKIMCANRRKIV